MPDRPRRWWAAALFSLAVPGLGQIYNGQGRKGAWAMGLGLVALPEAQVVSLWLPFYPWNLFLAVLLALAFWGYLFVDAVIVARRRRKGFEPRPYNRAGAYLAFIAVTWFFVNPCMRFLAQAGIGKAYKIPAGSMEDTVLKGDRILVDETAYGIEIPFVGKRMKPRAPKPGDLVVFQPPSPASPGNFQTKVYLKRCVAVGGQTVEIRDRVVLVDGRPFPEPAGVRWDAPDRFRAPDIMDPVKVPAGAFFVLGDNRGASADSRTWGCVPNQDARGRATRVCWSYDAGTGRIRWERIGQPLE